MSVHSVIGALIRGRASGLLRLRKADEDTNFSCLQDCAKCCSVLGGGVIADDAHEGGEPSVLPSCNGQCVFLKDGLCSIYERRPRGCREYPWYNVDGQLYYDSGCPGIGREGGGRPEPSSLSPVQIFLPLPVLLQRLTIRLMKIW